MSFVVAQSMFPKAVRVIEHTLVPLKDGTTLAARIWLPEDAEQNPVPAILEYLPYRKRDDEAEMTVYVDPDTIRRHGDLVKRWHLSDRKTVGGYGSIKSQREYDCAHQFNKVGTDAVRHENQRISTDNRNNGCLQRPAGVSPARQPV
jgi:hypothetical protein